MTGSPPPPRPPPSTACHARPLAMLNPVYTARHAPAPYAGVMTWRRRYVPHVGQATCGSLRSWHCGQSTSVGAAAFQFERRDRVLLRDILRLGTATSALLCR